MTDTLKTGIFKTRALTKDDCERIIRRIDRQIWKEKREKDLALPWYRRLGQ